MFSNKENINILTALLRAHGVTHAVVCPGSRNAPIVHNLSQALTCVPMTDERSAGFYALGMSQATGQPVVVCVTSGTALLNLAPAVAEAYYQHVPLVVVSADRPPQWIDQLDGQTLPQPGALGPFVRQTVSLPEPANDEQRWHCQRMVNEALCLATHREPAPVHVNVPISEPLFDFNVHRLPLVRPFRIDRPTHSRLHIDQLAQPLSRARRVMLVLGCSNERTFSQEQLCRLSHSFVVLYEPLRADAVEALPLDGVLRRAQNDEQDLYPDLIIYTGGTIVSKRLRQFLRRSGAPTWLLTTDARRINDPTMHLDRVVECDDAAELGQLIEDMALRCQGNTSADYLDRWNAALAQADEELARQYPDYSAQAVVKQFEQQLADNQQQPSSAASAAEVHYANSTAIRLACLYAHHHVWCNRGVNGIEGSLSTAAGFSLATSKNVYCVIGDLSFLYDQNALWNDQLQGNLRILLLNNGGGGIFQQLPGLEKAKGSLPLIAGNHHRHAKGICQQNNITYLSAKNQQDYEEALPDFIGHKGKRPVVLEVFFRALMIVMCAMVSCLTMAQTEHPDLLVMEWNVENLFDTTHDSLKNDQDFLPEGSYRWTRTRYWKKVNRVAQTIIASGCTDSTTVLPDLIGLCEVENDSVMVALTRRSLMRKARYDYVMTSSPDQRGIDVALVYQPFTFALDTAQSFRIPAAEDMRPTRDILYARGRLTTGDTLHVFVVHAPSRAGGETASRPKRLLVASVLAGKVDSIMDGRPHAKVIVMGDFNDYADDASLQLLYSHRLVNVSRQARGQHGAQGTYRYRGQWGSLDQVLVSEELAESVADCSIYDAPFLLEEDEKYGGVKPRRNYLGPHYHNGFSDHLPLVVRLRL